jgi:hypothetical protein
MSFLIGWVKLAKNIVCPGGGLVDLQQFPLFVLGGERGKRGMEGKRLELAWEQLGLWLLHDQCTFIPINTEKNIPKIHCTRTSQADGLELRAM